MEQRLRFPSLNMFLGTCALIPLFLYWGFQIQGKRIADWDREISIWCRSNRRVWLLFSRMGDGWLYVLVFLIWRNNRMANAVFLAWGISAALKLVVRRKRLNPGRRWNTLLLKRIGSWSFPSQHAATAVAFVVSTWPGHHMRPEAVLFAVAVSASRVLIGAHYLGDVLAGIAVGVLAGRLA